MNLLLDLLFPKKCVGCNVLGTYFCNSCIGDIRQTDLVCPKCERPAVGGQTHPVCRRRFGLDGLWSLGIYQDPLRSAIQTLKYKYVKELAEILTDITIEYWARFQPFLLDQIKRDQGDGWAVIPVPLHWYRQNWRGFNQAASLGEDLSKKLGLNYSEGLKRMRYTRQQVGLKGKRRHQNIKDAFVLSNPLSLSPKEGHVAPKPSVILVDDVWTTGSTLKECAFVLKRAGAKKVWALTLAK